MKDTSPRPTVLIFGGTAKERAAMGYALSDGFDCLIADDEEHAQTLMSDNFVHVAVASGGPDNVAGLLSNWPETMLVTVTDTPEAHDTEIQILPTTWSATQLSNAVSTASQLFQLRRENERLSLEMQCLKTQRPRPQASANTLGFEAILRAPGSPMANVVNAARQFASFDVPILLVGEASTGKAELARAIHDSSLRSDQPFHGIDATGLSDHAVARMLFGQRKPANGTPPVNRTGLVRKADNGTLYVSGIEALSRPLQMRLLRLVRDGLFEVGGETEPEVSRARVITSTSADPRTLIEEGHLDPALYYAMSIAELSLPSLKARKTDIPLLARMAAEDASRAHGKVVHGFSDAAMDFLLAYGWPGNLCELRNEVTRMMIRAQDPMLGPEAISRHILQAAPAPTVTGEAEIMTADGPLKDRVEAIEARILRETLTRLRWNKSRSAAELGLSRVGLRAKLERYGITPPQTEEA